MAKTKTKKSLIEKTVFNDHAYALAAKKKAEKRVGMIKVGLIISAVSTLATVFGVKFISSNSTVGGLLLFVAIIGAFASYIIGGGVKIALSSAWKLAKFGWFILPFPYDIITGILGFIFALFGFFLLPLIFVFINFLQNKSELDEANEYLKFCESTTDIEV